MTVRSTADAASPASTDAQQANQPNSSAPRRQLVPWLNRGIESMIREVERSHVLGTIGTAITQPVAKVLGSGPLKSLLSGSWLGHPAHPMLTDVPIGAWISASLLDLREILGSSGVRSRQGADTLVGVGVLAALPTAASGLSDLSDDIDKPILATGAAHATGSVLATGLFAASYLTRLRGKRASGIALSMIGAAVLTAAGLLGGHLSFRKGRGVDNNAFVGPLVDWTDTVHSSELTDGKPMRVSVAGHDVLLYRTNGTTYAIASRCSHRGGPLQEGTIEGLQVTCPWHGGQFCIEDGTVISGPPVAPQRSYNTRIHQGKIQIRSKS